MSIDKYFEDKIMVYVSKRNDENYHQLLACSHEKLDKVTTELNKDKNLEVDVFVDAWLIKHK